MYNETYLAHHGVKGMKWGVWNEDTRARYSGGKRHIKSSAKENILKSKSANLNKWGKDKNHNVLYVTGLSGSGKSTVVESLRNKDTNVIHLDFYLEAGNDRYSQAYRDKEFTSYLQKHTPDFFNTYNGNLPDASKLSLEEKQKLWKVLDSFEESIKGFGAQQFANNKNVICEGVQLSDEVLFPDKNFFKDQPLIILTTDSDTSIRRAAERDGIDVSDVETLAKRKSWQKIWSRGINKIANTSEAHSGEMYVEDLLKRL